MNRIKVVLLCILCSTVVLWSSCKKENTTTITCLGCEWRGIYAGAFHDVAGCYACVPYVDSVFTGSFTVDTLGADSIIITRLYDNYSWRWAANDSGKYSRSGCCTVIESFQFKEPDTLSYYYNNGGGGGYFREEFLGIK